MAEEQQNPNSPRLDGPVGESSSQQGALLHLLEELRIELDRILASLPTSSDAEHSASADSTRYEEERSHSEQANRPHP